MKKLKCDRGSEVRITGGKYLALLSLISLIIIFLSVLFYYNSLVCAWKLSFPSLFLLHGHPLCNIILFTTWEISSRSSHARTFPNNVDSATCQGLPMSPLETCFKGVAFPVVLPRATSKISSTARDEKLHVWSEIMCRYRCNTHKL